MQWQCLWNLSAVQVSKHSDHPKKQIKYFKTLPSIINDSGNRKSWGLNNKLNTQKFGNCCLLWHDLSQFPHVNILIVSTLDRQWPGQVFYWCLHPLISIDAIEGHLAEVLQHVQGLWNWRTEWNCKLRQDVQIKVAVVLMRIFQFEKHNIYS